MKRKTYNRMKRKAAAWNWVITRMFRDYQEDKDLDRLCDAIRKNRGVFHKYRDWIYASFFQYKSYLGSKGWWKEFNRKHPLTLDLRSGDETYGYASIEKIEENLDYISDRFAAEFRLTWMSELPEKVYKLRRKEKGLLTVVCRQAVDVLNDPEDRRDLNLGKGGCLIYPTEHSDPTKTLDDFHEHVAVGCLDDYEILCFDEDGNEVYEEAN